MTTRRELFGLAVGAAATPALAKLDALAAIYPPTPPYAELAAIYRKAFVPRVYVQLYMRKED